MRPRGEAISGGVAFRVDVRQIVRGAPALVWVGRCLSPWLCCLPACEHAYGTARRRRAFDRRGRRRHEIAHRIWKSTRRSSTKRLRSRARRGQSACAISGGVATFDRSGAALPRWFGLDLVALRHRWPDGLRQVRFGRVSHRRAIAAEHPAQTTKIQPSAGAAA